jgi:hypothetical protein
MIVERYNAGELYTSISFPPRYGKSDVIRLGALELKETGAPTSIVTTPWVNLVDQIRTNKKLKELFERYGIPETFPFLTKRIGSLQTSEWWKLMGGMPTLFSATISLLQNKSNRDQFLDGIEDICQTTSRRVPVFGDECQLIKQVEEWGKFVGQIVERGGYVVLLTGTPVKGMPGFKQDEEAWRDITYHLTRRRLVNGEIKTIQEIYEGQRRKIKIVADIEVSWAKAWDEGALSRVNQIWVDTEVFSESDGTSLGLLSAQDESELRGRLRSVMESKDFIVKLASAGVDRWLFWRKHRSPKTQMLVMTGSDVDVGNGRQANRHARQYRDAIQRALMAKSFDPHNIRIEIATSTDENGEPNQAAKKTLEDFRDGKVDILIVKMMALVGMDAPACKVAVWGGVLRQGPLTKQAFTRALTIWEETRAHADLILPNDKRMQKSYEIIIHDQGGDQETVGDKVDEREIEPELRDGWEVKGSLIAGYSNERGQSVKGESEEILFAIRSKYFVDPLSDVEVLKNYQQGAYPLTTAEIEAAKTKIAAQAVSGIRNLDEDLPKVKGTFGTAANLIVSKYLDYPTQRDKWIKAVVLLKSVAKDLCGVARAIRVDAIDDVDKLKQLIAALPRAEEQIKAQGGFAQ